MSLEETMAWFGRRLGRSAGVSSSYGGRVSRQQTSLDEAKRCRLSYWITTDLDDPSFAPATASAGSQRRERWTVDLSGLDPDKVRALAPERGSGSSVWFAAATSSRGAIGTRVYNNDRLSYTRNNVGLGHFPVGTQEAAAELATALKHAVELCRQANK